ncbi:MAG: glycosyltransferase [Acidiferrobacterales bacterium]
MGDRRPYRILHTIDTNGPGGAETVFVELAAQRMFPDDCNIVAITGTGWVHDELRRRGVSPYVISISGSFDIRYLYGLVRLIRRHRIDLIQSHLLGSNVYCSVAGLICGVPVVSTFHGSVDFCSSERHLAMKRFVLNRGSSRCVFVSDSLREEIVARSGISRSKAVTIHNGIDSAAFTPRRNDMLRRELALADDAIIVGAVGNIRVSKGYDTLLRAAALLRDGDPRYQFVVVGEGGNALAQRLQHLRRELGLDDVVHFIGFRQDVAPLLNSFDVFVLSSVSEGFSLATVQAMACGVPVVATRSGGPEEIITDGENGILVDVRTELQLADAIRRVTDDAVFRKSLAANALQLVRSRYTLDVMLLRYRALYEELIGQGVGGAPGRNAGR